MFDKTKIISSLNGLVGYQQPINPDYDDVSADNIISRSGRYVTENPMCKIEWLFDTIDYPSASAAQKNAYLTAIMNQSICSVFDQVFCDNDYVDRAMLYENANNKINAEVLPLGFVGYRILKSKGDNISFKISRVLTEFKTTGTIKLLLFNSSKSIPLQTKSITITSGLQETVLNWTLDNTTTIHEGEYFIGYIASGSTPIPYLRDYHGANIITDVEELAIESIFVSGHSSETMPDINLREGSSNCWGLNFDITVYKDFTDLIINSESLFARAIQLQAQIQGITNILANRRTNIEAIKSQEIFNQMVVELEGIEVTDGINKVGLKSILLGEIKRIRAEINRLKTNHIPGALITQTIC
jgi:hypothetical protein